MSIESNIKAKFKKQIEIFYESLVNSLCVFRITWHN